MSFSNAFQGPNAGYVLELYERYLQDPNSVDPASRAIFEQWTPDSSALTASPIGEMPVMKIVGAANLAQSIRKHGHHAARLDPLGTPSRGDPALDPASHGLTDADLATLPASIVNGPICSQAANAAEAILIYRYGLLAGLLQRGTTYLLWHVLWPSLS